MGKNKSISGFSRLTSAEKLEWLNSTFNVPAESINDLYSHLHREQSLQELYEEFSENTVSNFYIPYGLAPNFLINDKWYVLPMAIEESSVVAAASHAAKFWSGHGGFHATIIDTIKIGQVHFHWTGDGDVLKKLFNRKRRQLLASVKDLVASMEKRGGGITDITLLDKTDSLDQYYQLFVKFKTANAMGANFINSVLEKLGKEWKSIVDEAITHGELSGEVEITMAILSNYTPESLVKVTLETKTDQLGSFSAELSGSQFADKFVRAVEIAAADPYRAVTHNKGIFNGMDAVVIATGNDFRAVEACGHAYASRNGQYSSLSAARIEGDTFIFELEVPMAVGTVGGLTTGHPLSKISMQILQHPDANELMTIIAAAGMANNFSAVRSLITSGIQKGHMKMHLTNILRQLHAGKDEKKAALDYFSNRTVSYSAVKAFLNK